jgi:hypothetical protein
VAFRQDPLEFDLASVVSEDQLHRFNEILSKLCFFDAKRIPLPVRRNPRRSFVTWIVT